ELGAGCRLDVVAERRHEDVVPNAGDNRRGGADGEEWDAGLLEDRPDREHVLGVRQTNHRLDLVRLDQPSGGVGGGGDVGLAVVDNRFELLAVDSAFSVDLLERELAPLQRRLVDGRERPGDVVEQPDLDRSAGRRGRGAGRRRGGGRRGGGRGGSGGARRGWGRRRRGRGGGCRRRGSGGSSRGRGRGRGHRRCTGRSGGRGGAGAGEQRQRKQRAQERGRAHTGSPPSFVKRRPSPVWTWNGRNTGAVGQGEGASA